MEENKCNKIKLTDNRKEYQRKYMQSYNKKELTHYCEACSKNINFLNRYIHNKAKYHLENVKNNVIKPAEQTNDKIKQLEEDIKKLKMLFENKTHQ
jgi:hypothetical protein